MRSEAYRPAPRSPEKKIEDLLKNAIGLLGVAGTLLLLEGSADYGKAFGASFTFVGLHTIVEAISLASETQKISMMQWVRNQRKVN